MACGVIFDFNGTMIFDAPVNRQAWREFLAELIGRDCTEEEFYGRVQGGNGREIVAYFLGTAGIELPPAEVERLGVKIDEVYRRVLVSRPDLFRLAPGLPEFLDELVRRGIPRTIASAAPPENMDLFFGHLGLERWFDREQVTLNDGTLPGKPAPDMYLLAAKRLGLSASNCAVFEDARSGIEAARRAGAGAIVGVMSQFGEDEMLAIPGVTAATPDYRDIGRLVGLIESLA